VSDSSSQADEAVAVVETRGLVPLAAAVEAMVKTAGVEVIYVDRVGGGVVFAAVRGSVAAVRSAVATTREIGAAHRTEVFRVRMYVRPSATSVHILDRGLPGAR
jgi:ethanolamine utilization protein EutM